MSPRCVRCRGALWPVVDRHLLQLGGQQAGVDDGGEQLDGAGAVLALAAGQGAEGFDQGVGRRRQHGALVAVGGRRERLPHGVADVGESGLGEPAQLVEVEVAGQAQPLPQPLPQHADQHGAFAAWPMGPLLSEGGQRAQRGPLPVLCRFPFGMSRSACLVWASLTISIEGQGTSVSRSCPLRVARSLTCWHSQLDAWTTRWSGSLRGGRKAGYQSKRITPLRVPTANSPAGPASRAVQTEGKSMTVCTAPSWTPTMAARRPAATA